MTQASPLVADRLQRTEARWRLPTLAALLATIPAFYIELIDVLPTPLAVAIYLGAALLLLAGMARCAVASGRQAAYWWQRRTDVLLAAGLVLAALLPPSGGHDAALAARLAVALLTLARMVWLARAWLTRGSLGHLLLLALCVLSLSGAGFWALEPEVRTLSQGMWLAFTTAATVGYGDMVPHTPAGRIFAVFVVLLGYAVLSLVTAAIAAFWVERTERHAERDLLHGLQREMQALRREIAALRGQGPQGPAPPEA